MTAYRPNRRDPLTYRWAHSVRDTIDDPYAYSEGPAEPEHIVVERPSFSRTCTYGHRAAWLIPIIATVLAVIVGYITKGV